MPKPQTDETKRELNVNVNADRVNISRHSPWGRDAHGSESEMDEAVAVARGCILVLAGLVFILGSYYTTYIRTIRGKFATMVFRYNERARK